MVRPRRCSSASRSGHMPVSRCTSVDLPWSTCPAVAMTYMPAPPVPSASSSSGRDRAQVQQAAAALQTPDDGRRAGPQRRGVGLGQADRRAGQLHAGRPASADGRDASPPPGRRAARRRAVRARSAQARPRRRQAPGPPAEAGRRRVASSAARVSLSTRSARAAGCRRSRSISSASPNSRPACGPPSSLSPLAVTRSAPSRSTVVASGSSGSSGCGVSRPEPMSTTSGTPSAGQLGDRRPPT